MGIPETRSGGLFLPITLVLVLVAGVLIFVVPTVDSPVIVAGCFEGLGDPPAKPKITLWEQWKWNRKVQHLIERWTNKSGSDP